MEKLQKEVLQITKEIVVKFVEAGRITPTNFAEHFPAVYAVVSDTLAKGDERGAPTSPTSMDEPVSVETVLKSISKK